MPGWRRDELPSLALLMKCLKILSHFSFSCAPPMLCVYVCVRVCVLMDGPGSTCKVSQLRSMLVLLRSERIRNAWENL